MLRLIKISHFKGALLVLCCAALGCASTREGKGPFYEAAETSLDEAQAEVVAAPTEFFMSNQDDRFAWERARYFLEHYSGSAATGSSAGSSVVSKVVGSRWGLQRQGQEFSYEVWKQPAAGGYRYVVTCAALADDSAVQQQARLNAGNLARFVTQGKLELSILRR